LKLLGAHVSVEGGVRTAPGRASELGAKAFGLFVKNQLQWSAKPLGRQEATAFKRACAARGYSAEQILPHAGYLINLGSPQEDGLARSREAFLDEMRRCASLGLTRLNVHPGSHKGLISEEACLQRVADSVNLALGATRGVTVVLENTAGAGGTVGRSFEQLAQIIGKVQARSRVGVCLDTCHLFAAGYDLRTGRACERTLRAFEDVVGLGFLKGLHLNDARSPLGNRVDRHASLGEGELGWRPFRWIMQDGRFEGIPLILETPDPGRWRDEIAELYSMVGQQNKRWLSE
jgi:deoxyribonuclease-4